MIVCNHTRLFVMMRAVLLSVSCLVVFSCRKEVIPETYTDNEIALFPKSIDGGLQTKAVTTLSTLESSGFRASATTVSGETETQVWTNSLFTKSGELFKGGRYWPSTNRGYRFYGSSSALTFTASGNTVTVPEGNTADVVCAYKASSNYMTANSLDFHHILSKITTVRVNAESPCTISNITISLVDAKTGGVYNLRSGAWSSKTPASSSNRQLYRNAGSVAAGSGHTGSDNDYVFVPGSYYLQASWTATVGEYSKTYTNKLSTSAVTFAAENQYSVTANLSGDPTKIEFAVSVEPWGSNTIAIGTFWTPPATFGGLDIAPGPLYYNGSSYAMYSDWNHSSYYSAYGKNAGSTYFNFIQMGELFEKSGFSSSDGSIENTLNPLDGWRLPTRAEWCTLTTGASPGTSRAGSTVNGNSGAKYALIQLTGVAHASSPTPIGLLLFPDGKTITGKTLSGINNTTQTTGVTASELNAYLEQGCVFLPEGGYCYVGDWDYGGSYGSYWSSTEYNSGYAYCFLFYSSNFDPSWCYNKSYYYFPVRLVRNQ